MRRIDAEIERRAIQLYSDPEQRLSEYKVGQMLGISQRSVHNILVRNNEPRRSMSAAKMKYPKTDFSGDPAEQARLVGFIEDCGARYYHTQIGVDTSTTHPGQISLFNKLLGNYGHVAIYPAYNKPRSSYQWHVYAYLNASFDFLPRYKRNPMEILAEIVDNGFETVRIGSLTDAEGWAGIDANNGNTRTNLEITNNSRQLLVFTRKTIGGGIVRSANCYKLRLHGKEAVDALRKLPVTHVEKVAAKELILRHYDKGGIGLEALGEYRELRRKIDDEVRLCTLHARLEYIRRKGKPHEDDPDQTIPQNLTLSPSFFF